jgi:hypothetical protein
VLYIGYMKENLDYTIIIIPLTILPLTKMIGLINLTFLFSIFIL